jgi:hypothetical protein
MDYYVVFVAMVAGALGHMLVAGRAQTEKPRSVRPDEDADNTGTGTEATKRTQYAEAMVAVCESMNDVFAAMDDCELAVLAVDADRFASSYVRLLGACDTASKRMPTWVPSDDLCGAHAIRHAVGRAPTAALAIKMPKRMRDSLVGKLP